MICAAAMKEIKIAGMRIKYFFINRLNKAVKLRISNGLSGHYKLLNGKTSENEAFTTTYALIKKRMQEEVIPFFL